VVNGRMSERSMRDICSRGAFSKTHLAAQSDHDAKPRTMRAATANSTAWPSMPKIIVTGNTKISADAENEMPIRPELLAFAPERQFLSQARRLPAKSWCSSTRIVNCANDSGISRW